MNTNKRKKIIILICLSIGALMLIATIFNYVNFISVKTKANLTNDEKSLICGEFYLKSDAGIDYIYYQGFDRYGVRIKLSENTDSYIVGALNVDMDISKLEEYLSDSSTDEYKTSKGEYVSAKDVSVCFTSYKLSGLNAYVFEENENYYLEIEKNTTDNISVFNK